MKNDKRASGIILHPSSFPGPDGIGDLGLQAYQWIDQLSRAGCALWQILPLGPTGYGDSPYQSFSAFAGNPYLVSATSLLDDGLIEYTDLSARPVFDNDCIDYGRAISWKLSILDRAVANFSKSKPKKLFSEYQLFLDMNKTWLDDFTLFMAIKEYFGGISWVDWPQPFKKREPGVLSKFQSENSRIINRHAIRQFFFFRQWKALKAHANKNKISIIGDIPIFVSFDSSDTWSNPDLFMMGKNLELLTVAGVPPDYFSPTGQLWGNPLYDWKTHRTNNYAWWKARIKSTLDLVDIIRLDHFRGFAGYWEVKAGMPTAEKGRWVKGPGEDFFNEIINSLGKVPIIAEDLGEITPDVIELREKFNLPGMKILQFAFANDPKDNFLPHNYPSLSVAYTGTHDNDTSLGWYDKASEKEKDFCRRYLSCSGSDISWDLIRSVWMSVSQFALAPMQDFLSLGGEARMNFPSKLGGNWNWRMRPGAMSDDLVSKIAELNYLYDRTSQFKESKGETKPIVYQSP